MPTLDDGGGTDLLGDCRMHSVGADREVRFDLVPRPALRGDDPANPAIEIPDYVVGAKTVPDVHSAGRSGIDQDSIKEHAPRRVQRIDLVSGLDRNGDVVSSV